MAHIDGGVKTAIDADQIESRQIDSESRSWWKDNWISTLPQSLVHGIIFEYAQCIFRICSMFIYLRNHLAHG